MGHFPIYLCLHFFGSGGKPFPIPFYFLTSPPVQSPLKIVQVFTKIDIGNFRCHSSASIGSVQYGQFDQFDI